MSHSGSPGYDAPRGGSGTLVTFSDEQTQTLRIVDGSGALVMAHADLEPTRIPSRVGIWKPLPPEECRAYPYDPNFPGFALVDARGENVTFAILRSGDFSLVSRGEGRFRESFDGDRIPGVVVQACNWTNATRMFSIDIQEDPDSHPSRLVPLGAPVVTVALAAASWRRRR